MINEIEYIYILDNHGEPFYIRENHPSGTENVDHALLSGFINALQSFATEFGEKETRVIELSNNIIFALKDDRYQLQFVLKCIKSAKAKKMFKILKNIKDIFLNIFSTYFETGAGNKEELMKKFLKDLNIILEPNDNLENFFKP